MRRPLATGSRGAVGRRAGRRRRGGLSDMHRVYVCRRAAVSESVNVSGQRSAVSGQRSAVSGQRSAVSGQRSAVSGQRSAVSGQRSAVSGQRSAVEASGHRRVASEGGAEAPQLRIVRAADDGRGAHGWRRTDSKIPSLRSAWPIRGFRGTANAPSFWLGAVTLIPWQWPIFHRGLLPQYRRR